MAIEEFVNRMLSKIGSPFIQAKVIKSDSSRKVVWVRELGSIPVPLIAFDYQVKYSYREASGTLQIQKTKAYSEEVDVLTPRVGDTVLIAQHFGASRLPKCLGVIKSRNYIEPTGE